jgi:ankyrin repeat protein
VRSRGRQRPRTSRSAATCTRGISAGKGFRWAATFASLRGLSGTARRVLTPPAGRSPEARSPAACRGVPERVAAARRLIDASADVNAKDGTRQSAYLIATSEVGDDPRLLELTLDAGADVNAKDRFNGTGLIRAAERGHSAIVRRLLETDIDVDHVNRLGWTALLEAVILGEGGPAHIRTVRLLVDAGADASIADESGTTALEHARRRGFDEIEQMLREAG